MTDFLDALEHELAAAAHRRAASPQPSGRQAFDDLRAVGRGVLITATVAIVALVVAAVALAGRPHAPSARPATPTRATTPASGAASGVRSTALTCRPRGAGSAASRALAVWLSGAPPAGGSEQQDALRRLDRPAAQAVVVDVRSIRTVTVAGLGPVTLVPVLRCGTPGPVVLAEVPARVGIATIDLGTLSAIRSGAAFHARSLMVRTTRGLRMVSGVPEGTVRVLCVEAGVSHAFPVVGHLVSLPAEPGACNLVERVGPGAGASAE